MLQWMSDPRQVTYDDVVALNLYLCEGQDTVTFS